MPMSLAAKLDRTLRESGLVFDGVSIGRPEDPTTWDVQYATKPTPAQESLATAIMARFNPNDQVFVDAEAEAGAVADIDNNKPLLAFARAVYPYLGPDKPKSVELLIQEWRALYVKESAR